ncbi:uncharacterized protein LOC105250932 [Camponotus floridanus]|uniref:uncharacterized protein LOC105250932 n=1 Tax=Camponotus floridanus TaxID=104421 RepID=UPI00059C8EBF|nr:uncharacterized protein LOC105250932 [Camponotus floridanus]
MSEGADSVTRTRGDSLQATSAREGDAQRTTGTATPSPPPPPLPPPPPSTYTGRRPRFGTGGPPPSPYMWIDGRQLRSALAWTNKWPMRPPDAVPLRVSFPASDNHLVTGYLEPANPWRHAENVNREDLIFSYKESCIRHNTKPLPNVLVQLENLDVSQDRCEQLNLKGEILDQDHSEPLEEILKRVQFNKINLEGASLNDESSVILFDMLEYYESAKHLNISFNPEIGARGWQACSHMIKKTQCLEQLEARDIQFNEQNMNILSRALRLVGHLHVLKLENCGLSGRAIVILVTALKMNSGIRELYLADNGLDLYDAIQLGSLLRMNNHLQLLDISNNNVQDDGVRDILEGLINQVNEDKTGKGLSILILWNNRLTKNSSPYISRIIALSKTLETLNIGQNMLTDEALRIVKESLKQNRVLLQLGMQSTELTCEGIITLAEIMEMNQVLQRIDLRDNNIKLRGMHALVNVMKTNKTVTQIDLDDRPRIRIDGPLNEYVELIVEIRSRCGQNEERRLLEESTEDAESPQYPSLNASSRKISLTCQTLPSPSSGRSTTSLAANEPATRTTLEPAKRTSGGRLRSPAPSPIPSPVASPIPSPSRNRFVVCRVPEASLRSTDSSASTSPVTPPSLGSSPNFFSGASSGGPSRFRVSVVESAGAGRSPPKSVIASTSGSSVTIGFNVKIDAADSNDSDNVIDKTSASSKTAASASDMLHVVPLARETSSSSEDIAKNEDRCNEETKTSSSEQQVKVRLEVGEIVTATPKGKYDKMTEIKEEERLEDQNDIIGTLQSEKNEMDYSNENENNRSNVMTMDLENAAIADNEAIINRNIVYTSTKELQVPAYPNEDTISTSIVEDKENANAIKLSLDNISELNRTTEELSTCISRSSANSIWTGTSSIRTTESHSREQPSTSVQKHKSSLEKLLSLFQHPGQFFSDSSSTTSVMDTKSSLQENVSGVMALGDKLQQYLKEGRTKIDGSWSSEHGSPLKNKSMGLNISQLQNLTGIFASFKFEPQASLVEHGTKFFGQTKTQDAREDIKEKNLEELIETEVARDDNERNLSDRETNQLIRNYGNLIEQHQVIKSDENDLFHQKQNQSIKNDEKNLDKQNQFIERNENLLGQEKSQVENDEQKLFNQISRSDEKDSISQEKSQILINDENKLFDRMKNRTIEIDERNLEDQKKGQEIIRNTGENVKGSGEMNIQRRDEVANNDPEDERLRNDIARNDGKDSVSIRDGTRNVNEEKDVCNADDLRGTESDRISDRLLPESVQSKDDFANNLVLDDGHVATSAAVVLSSFPASESTAYINVSLTDIVEYSTLGLSNIADICIECNDTKRFEDFISEEERDDAPQDSPKCTERDDDAECLKHDNLEILGNNDARCLQRDDAVEETNAAIIRTCDTITDSINQTSDSRFFPISNVAYDSKKAVDSVSIASITTDDDVDVIRPASENSGLSTSSTSLFTGASVYLNEEVTNNTHRDRRCDFTRKREEKEDLHDNAYRDSVDRATSTSVNIKIDPHGESETTSPHGSQEAPERRLLMPNNINKHRTILEDAAETTCHSGDEQGKQTVDPMILVTPSSHEISVISLDKSDAEELIFCMTDVSTDGTSIEDELSPQGIAPRSSLNKLAESYYELPASRTNVSTSGTLLIENPGSVHRNSQDSGIEETALTIDDTVVGITELPPIPPPPPPPPRSSLQESVDSGIESECSSICIRMESATGINTLEMVATPKRPTRDDNDDEEEFGEFASDFLARETRLVDSTSGDGDGDSYLSGVKCTVVNTMRPVADEGVARPTAPMIAHSPATVHGTSPK